MNRKSFDALVKLFAISLNRNLDLDMTNVKHAFRNFLVDYLDPKYVESFVILFYKYLEEYSSKTSNKKLSLNSVKLISVCEKTAAILSSTERAIIVFNLARLIAETGSLNASEEFIKLVSDIYDIPKESVLRLLLFLKNKKVDDEFYLNNNRSPYAIGFKYTAEVYALKNVLDEEFSIDTVKVPEGKLCYALKESVISFKDQTKSFFIDHVSQFDFAKSDIFSIRLKDISVRKNNKQILHKTSIILKSEDFVGVIGNSGSGKTSLLKTLAGLNNGVEGAIYSNCDKTQLNFSYLSQEYDFIPNFTVAEHLKHRADFLQLNSIESSQNIDRIIESVGLDGHVDQIAVRNDGSSFQLSGGQLKRLKIAMELLAIPDVFILDEPTSGLSSEDSFQILSILKRIACKNKLVISAIHQPDYDSLLLFDKIIVLDNGGFPVYYGSPLKAANYLRNITDRVDRSTVLEISKNPSVILSLLELPTIEKPNNNNNMGVNQWYERFKESDMWSNEQEQENDIIKPGNRRKLNPIKSYAINLKFELKIERKSYLRFLFLFAVPLITGLLFSLISRYSQADIYEYYYNFNIPIWILITVITSLFVGMVSAGNEFVNLRNYHISEYYIYNKYLSLCAAKFSKYFLISFIQSALLIVPAIYMLDMEFALKEIFFIIWVLTFFGSILGMLISALFKSSSVVYLVLPLVIVLNMLFSGVLIKFDSFNKNIFGDNPSTVSRIANILPAYPATNTIMSELYLFNDFQSKIYEIKVIHFENIYYLNYFIPELSDIAKNDSLLAKEILRNEILRNDLFPNIINDDIKESIETIKLFYTSQSEAMLGMNSNLFADVKISNNSIDKIVNLYYANKIILIDNRLDRQFMTAYIPPYYSIEDKMFVPYKELGKHKIELFAFTLIKLLFLSLISFILILFLKFRFKRN